MLCRNRGIPILVSYWQFIQSVEHQDVSCKYRWITYYTETLKTDNNSPTKLLYPILWLVYLVLSATLELAQFLMLDLLMGRNRCNYLYLFNKKGINPQLASFASMHSLKKIDYTINLSRIAHCTATKTSSEIFENLAQDPCLSIVISNSVYVCHSQHY